MSKAAYDSLRCSFCHKSQDVVGKLIASAHVYHTERAYICDECIPICVAILEDDRTEGSEPASLPPPQIKNPLLLHPLAPKLLAAVEAWVRAEDLGIIGAQTDLMEVRQIGRIMFGLTAE